MADVRGCFLRAADMPPTPDAGRVLDGRIAQGTSLPKATELRPAPVFPGQSPKVKSDGPLRTMDAAADQSGCGPTAL